MAGRLAGEVALVTGSTSGIGAEIARLFAAEGAAVVVTGRRAEAGSALVGSIEAATAPETAVFVAGDLTDPATPGRLVAAAVERFGRLSVLVNNAVAHVRGAAIADTKDADWDARLLVDLTAVARMCRAAIPAMAAAGGGSIVNVSSRAAERGTPNQAAYSVAKGGMNALTRSIAADYARAGIRANTVAPGYVLHAERDAGLTPERRRQLEAMHLTRLGTATDVAYAALYLASAESAFVTGILLPVDGGSTIARAASFG